MTKHGSYDHELKIGTTTRSLTLARNDDGSPMYQVREEIPQYRNPLRYEQTNWIGGHGQHDFVQPDMYFEGQSIDTTQEGRVFLGPLIYEVKESDDTVLDSAVVCFLWFEAGSKLLCATSGKIYRYDVGSNAKWTAATTTVAGVTDMIVMGAIVYAAVGSSTLWYYSTDGITWTQTDLTNAQAQKFKVAPNPAGTADVLWSFKQPNELYNTTDGRTAAAGGVALSSAAYIGDSSTNITNLFLVNDNLMVGREDNLFHHDSNGGIHPLRPDLQKNRSTDNFKYVMEWQTGVYHSEIDGMGRLSSYNSYAPMGPLYNIGDIGKRGDIKGLASDKDWQYVVVDEGTNTHIYKGRQWRTPRGIRWEWCPWVFLSTNTTATLATCQHSSTDRRLWFGYGASGTTTGYVILSDNPTDDSAARFCASGFLRMSYDYGTDAEWDKMWQSAILEVIGGASGETVQVKYRKDTDTSATSCIAAASTNGVYETNFSSELSCNRIQFELHLASDTNTATPEVSYFQAKGVEKPVTVRTHECVYSVGSKPTRLVSTVRTFLRGGRTSTSLIKFADLRYGDSTGSTSYVWVAMEPGYPEEIEIRHEKGRLPEMGIRVRFREVSFTIS